MMVSFRQSLGIEQGLVLCLNVSRFMITSSSRSCVASLLALFCVCLVFVAAPPHYLILPISLNNLDLVGVRLLSPRGSQITSNSCRCR